MHERPVEEQFARWISLHQRGIITRLEMLGHIGSCTFVPGFFERLGSLPTDIVEVLSGWAAGEIPAHPEDVILGNAYYAPMTPEEWRAWQLHSRQVGYWSARLKRRYFHPDLPMPPFEPLRHIGTVAESVQVDEFVALTGVSKLLIHANPIHLVPPSGPPVVTSELWDDPVRLPSAEAVAAFWKRYRQGLFLAANVRSPAEVPPGTEVWVDRTAAAPIPPLGDLFPGRDDLLRVGL